MTRTLSIVGPLLALSLLVDALEHAWGRLAPDLATRVAATAAATGPKAWRFEGEMHEIAATFGAAGLPVGFHRAAAEVYAYGTAVSLDPPA